eukprot:COSAG02_NODE_16764_length_1057_cov_1.382046_2_plen_88_part_00
MAATWSVARTGSLCSALTLMHLQLVDCMVRKVQSSAVAVPKSAAAVKRVVNCVIAMVAVVMFRVAVPVENTHETRHAARLPCFSEQR